MPLVNLTPKVKPQHFIFNHSGLILRSQISKAIPRGSKVDLAQIGGWQAAANLHQLNCCLEHSKPSTLRPLTWLKNIKHNHRITHKKETYVGIDGIVGLASTAFSARVLNAPSEMACCPLGTECSWSLGSFAASVHVRWYCLLSSAEAAR